MKLRVAVAGAEYACLSRMLEPRPSRFRAATVRERYASGAVFARPEGMHSMRNLTPDARFLTVAAQYAAPYRMQAIKSLEESAS